MIKHKKKIMVVVKKKEIADPIQVQHPHFLESLEGENI